MLAKFANQSITAFEHDWQNSGKVRTEAKDVSDKVGQLLDLFRPAECANYLVNSGYGSV